MLYVCVAMSFFVFVRSGREKVAGLYVCMYVCLEVV